eukprot:TRINITY_DN14745_c0_g1_i1.p1 TRINITY_DN14745_c0_g1~~TRINITY_DN14745_c0_g1_i1.p1  ORF type:complete len:152 (+),score=16.66 TRINITY_DN14745_c0_g1_i1:122-577(+)
MSVKFLKRPLAVDVVLSENADGDPVVGVEKICGDYMVVPLEVKDRKGEIKFSLHVDGFGFEIGQHDNEMGMTRKLSDPFLSMIPAPAKKIASYPPRTGTFNLVISGRELLVEIPNYDGQPTLRKYTITDVDKLSLCLGGQVFVTLKGVTVC